MSERTCHNCGLPLVKNPHPDAGKLLAINRVGTAWGCLPCAERRANSRGRLMEKFRGWLRRNNDVLHDAADASEGSNLFDRGRAAQAGRAIEELDSMEEERKRLFRSGQ